MLLVLPSANGGVNPFPPELQRAALTKTLTSSPVFPENLKEHLSAQWSEEMTVPDRTNRSNV